MLFFLSKATAGQSDFSKDKTGSPLPIIGMSYRSILSLSTEEKTVFSWVPALRENVLPATVSRVSGGEEGAVPLVFRVKHALAALVSERTGERSPGVLRGQHLGTPEPLEHRYLLRYLIS